MSQYCNALFDSALILEKASIEITRDVVASLCTNDIKTKFDAKIKASRVQKTVSKSTIATQHNSTLNAFNALRMLNVTRNANNDDVFTLNRDNAIVQAIAARKNVALKSDAEVSA
jgi:HSP90 family molecular chaperone